MCVDFCLLETWTCLSYYPTSAAHLPISLVDVGFVAVCHSRGFVQMSLDLGRLFLLQASWNNLYGRAKPVAEGFPMGGIRQVSLNYLFIYLWLCWVFVSVRGLSLVAASGGHSSSRPLLLRSTGSRCAGSAIVAHGPSCSAACGIFPDQGSNPCPLHWQADSQPPRHQGSPQAGILTFY